MLASDEGGHSITKTAQMDDYCDGILPVRLIERGNMLFADTSGAIPWKAYALF